MSAGEGISGNSSKGRGNEDRRVIRKIFDSAYSPEGVEGVFCELRVDGVLRSSSVQFYEVELGCSEVSALRRPPTMVSRYTTSLKATTVCLIPASQVSRDSGPASTTASAASKRMRPSRTLRLKGPGAACSSSLSPAFITRSTTFMPSPLRSVMELRCPRCQAPSSRRRPTSASKSNLCKGPCKGRSDPGCGLLDIPLPPFSGYPLACTSHAIKNHKSALYSAECVEGLFSEGGIAPVRYLSASDAHGREGSDPSSDLA